MPNTRKTPPPPTQNYSYDGFENFINTLNKKFEVLFERQDKEEKILKICGELVNRFLEVSQEIAILKEEIRILKQKTLLI